MEHYVIKPAGEAGEAAVHAGLRAYNRTFVSDTADLSLAVRNEAGRIVGGCDAFRMGELVFLDALWGAIRISVHRARRRDVPYRFDSFHLLQSRPPVILSLIHI